MSDTTPQYDVTDIDIRIAQAAQLEQRIFRSCVFVEMIIFYIFAMLILGAGVYQATVWLTISSLMVAITFVYTKIFARDGIDRENVDQFLFGHVVISSLTGFAWGLLAIYFVDFDSAFSLFISSIIVSTVVLGGMMPGATYRPGFIGLATFMLIPFGIYILIFANGPFRLAGFGILILYIYGIVANLQAQRNADEAVFARQLQELNSKIRSQNDIIRRANAEKTRFLVATSHDFSQPLHAQGYFIQALAKKLKGKEQKGLLAKIETSWLHQKRLLEGLVEINRLDSGTIVPKIQTVDIRTRLQNLVNEFEDIAGEKNITLESELHQIFASSDPHLFTRIIQNLLSNAVRYTPNDGVVQLNAVQKDEQIFVTVEDTGPGIDSAHHQRIFEEYIQLHDNSPDLQSGLGLGLSIVKRLVKILNLELELESESGEGTKFTLILPTESSLDRITTKQDQTELSYPQATPVTGKPLVVIVDDESIILQSMSALLTAWGYALITAADPKQAFDELNKTDDIPALLIIDKRLGKGVNGVDLIRDLREEVNEDTPAILMSGDLTTPKKGIPLDNVQFMAKPVDPDGLRLMMAEMIVTE